MPNRDSNRRQRALDPEKRTRAILEIAFDAFLEVDRDGVITDWNARAEAAFGWPRKAAIGQHAQMLVPQRHRDSFVSDLGRIIEAGESFVADKPARIRCIHREGREFSGELILYPAQQNGSYRLSAFLRDLTERRRLEAALREIEDHRAIVNFIEDGYVEHDLRGNILFVNDAYCRLFGRRREEVLDASYKKIIQSSVSVDLPGLYNRVYRTGEPIKAFTYEFQPGRFVEITVSLKRGAKGEPTGFLTITRDCTKRERHEQQLARARDAAEAASQAKSDFLANMSHEIRTPMNGIIGMTELALGTELTAEQRDFLAIVRDSADSLLGVINDILDFSKIEAGKLALDSLPFDLEDCVASTLKSVALSAHRKGLELAFYLDPEVPNNLIGDPMRLRQVLLNLIGNAIKFTEQGEVVLRVKAEESKDGEARLVFSVRDTGIGINPDKQARIFEAFEQADTSITRKYEGTGLGLAISRRIVEAMGGKLWVESEPGAGSTFHFNAGFSIAAASAQTVLAELDDLSSLRVLIIDDNATNRWILQQMLKRWRMEAAGADCGRVGLHKLDRSLAYGQPFGLVIIDEQMPGMGGLDVIRAIRANPVLSGTPILMLTSANQSASAAKCRELQVESYLVKPIKPAELERAIRTALGLQQRRSERSGPDRLESKQPLRILVAEDNAVNQKLAAAVLQRMGHKVTVVSTGADAVASWATGEFALILMDVQMPDMDGFEATRRIRAQELITGGHVPVIAMTARAMQGDRERCLAAGMDEYITKPIDTQRLEQTIARFSAQPAGVRTSRSQGISRAAKVVHTRRRLAVKD